MSNLRKKLKITRDEKGQTLIYVLVAMILGALVIGPLLAYVNTSLVLSSRTQDATEAYYAADAGVAWAISELIQAQGDPDDYYVIGGSVTFDGYAVIYYCNATSGAPEPRDPYTYLDPYNDTTYDGGYGATFPGNVYVERNADLDALYCELDTIEYWEFTFFAVAGSDVTVNWVFTPEDCPWQLFLDGALIEWGAQGPVQESFTVGSTGAHTIEFWNVSSGAEAKTITSKPYSGGDSDFTWVQVGGYQDYIITSSAKDAVGNVRATVTAYVRQTPGPSKYWLSQQISVFSWQID